MVGRTVIRIELGQRTADFLKSLAVDLVDQEVTDMSKGVGDLVFVRSKARRAQAVAVEHENSSGSVYVQRPMLVFGFLSRWIEVAQRLEVDP